MLAGLKLPAPQPLKYYPLHFSHARFDSLMPTEKWLEDRIGEDASVLVFKTKSSGGEDEAKATSKDTMEYMPTDFEIGQIMDTGGVFGIRTGPNAIMPYKFGPKNNCLTSSRSIAQMVA